MKRNNLRFIKSFIKVYIGKNLKNCKIDFNNYDQIFLNLILFIALVLVFQKLEITKINKSEDVLKNPKIFWKLMQPKLIYKSYLLTLVFLAQYSEKKEIYQNHLSHESEHKVEKILHYHLDNYQELLKIAFNVNDILLNEIKNNSLNVINLVKEVDELKKILEQLFYQSANYIIYLYFINIDN
ncbi:hypothetical protein MCAV_05060 [[Mycoplasma] cavipharyngis]|uniref:hypothetical protein n=1 Tax=[Mycoplasma] cavipharyngis TaxID=92757 RepID=UPI0037047614